MVRMRAFPNTFYLCDQLDDAWETLWICESNCTLVLHFQRFSAYGFDKLSQPCPCSCGKECSFLTSPSAFTTLMDLLIVEDSAHKCVYMDMLFFFLVSVFLLMTST